MRPTIARSGRISCFRSRSQL
nr:unnamed protein product [Callosobruchus chinensis]